MNSPVFKSLLYVPADKPRMMEKARELACHAIIFDFEDSVGPDQKIAARENLVKYLQNQISIPYFVRINPVGTDYFEADILALIKIKPLGIILPKATERTVIAASAALDNLGEPAASSQPRRGRPCGRAHRSPSAAELEWLGARSSIPVRAPVRKGSPRGSVGGDC